MTHLTNRAGQGVGTVVTAVAGYAMFNAGGGVTVLSGGSAAEVSVPVAVAGVVTVAGATVNAVNIAATPMQRNSSGDYSKDDAERMKKGRAPTGSDGNPKELHHPNQNPKAPVPEMTRTEHRGKGNYGKNHPRGNKQPSQIDRQKFKKEREQYWKNKAKEMENK